MISRSTKLLYLILFIILLGCRQEKVSERVAKHNQLVEQAASFVVSPDDAVDININDLVAETRFIPLVLPEGILLREIRTVIFDKDTIYLLEMDTYEGTAPRVIRFDLNGTFIYAIDYHGQGPTELKYYDKITGEYAKSMKNPVATMQIISMINDSTIVNGCRKVQG